MGRCCEKESNMAERAAGREATCRGPYTKVLLRFVLKYANKVCSMCACAKEREAFVFAFRKLRGVLRVRRQGTAYRVLRRRTERVYQPRTKGCVLYSPIHSLFFNFESIISIPRMHIHSFLGVVKPRVI